MSTTTIDDQSTNVQYSGNWVKGGTVHEYNGTVSSSTTVGDFFILTFTGKVLGFPSILLSLPHYSCCFA